MTARFRTLLLTTSALLALGTVPAAAGPDGPAVVGGSASVSGAGTGSVVVNQSSSRAIINWTTFNLGAGESARFNQPNSSSVILNRVTGGLGASTIDGALSANGRVYIINRDGILFGRNAVINTASFLATTSDIRNQDFMAGRMNFNIPGRADASIVNLGRITAQTGGFAALVAPGVRNSGTITANLGTVALASGNMFTLDMYGDRLIQLAISDSVASQVIDVETGKPLKSLVTNDGKLKANGGRVELTAVQARAVVDSVINTKGVIEANSVGMRNGKIVLGGATASRKSEGAPRQVVKVSGRISAAGRKKGATGGTVLITGEDIRFANAVIDASGRAGGGKVLIGGDWGGGNPNKSLVSNNASAALESYSIDHASTVTMDAGSRITASARDSGNGGKVILWSDVATTFAGVIEAKGGAASGDGGFVETSSHGLLAFDGTVNTLAPNGHIGTLLLDPFDVTISAGADSNHDGSFTATGNDSVVNVVTLQNALATNNVTVSTGVGIGGQQGDITVATAINWASASTLTLHADNNIAINAAITATNGGLNLDAGADISATAAINVGKFTLTDGSWSQIATNLPAFQANDFQIVRGSFLRVTGGNADHPYQIADVYGLQGINSSSGLRSHDWVLVNNIDASGTAAWNYGAGFVPIGTDSGAAAFSGNFNGQGFTINGLKIASPHLGVGLFGSLDGGGSITNVNLTNLYIPATKDNQFIGGLVGTIGDGRVENVSVSGIINAATVPGGPFLDVVAGGVVGINSASGAITSARAAVNVTIGDGSGGTSSTDHLGAGGLVGENSGSIRFSSASGNVTAGGNTASGGLVGLNESSGTISGSFATGAVLSHSTTEFYAAAAGGLVGYNQGNIDTSFATGNVSNTGTMRVVDVGGLVGNQEAGTIQTSYASGNATITNIIATNIGVAAQVSAGGLVGGTQGAAQIRDSYALGNVSIVLNNNPDHVNYHGNAGGFIGFNAGDVTRAYSTGAVSATGSGDNRIGGFIGQLEGGAVNSAFWDKGTSGQPTAVGNSVVAGITGLATADAFTQSKYVGLDFTIGNTNWFMVDGQTRPFLQMEASSTITNAHQLQLMAMDLGASYTLANNIDFAGQFSDSGMWRNGSFAPIGDIGSPFTGVLDGAGHTISGLSINSSAQYVGLFGIIGANGAVRDLNFADSHITVDGSPANQSLGIQAGRNDGSIARVGTVGSNNTVDGGSHIGIQAGGLVGLNNGTIAGVVGTGTDVNVAVTVAGSNKGDHTNYAGGLAGINTGTITDMRAAGTVTGGSGNNFIGGLVGQNGNTGQSNAGNTALIQNSSASGNVSGGDTVGGLVGFNTASGGTATITNSQAFGTVTLTADGNVAGGLVGSNDGTVNGTSAPAGASCGAGMSCASGKVAGTSAEMGGFVGTNSVRGTISNSFATGEVAVTGSDNDGATGGGFVGTNNGQITGSFASGPVGSTGGARLGGFAGTNEPGGTILGSSASGNVTSTGAVAIAGGFVGMNGGTVSQSQATGNLSINTDIGFGGGFVGVNFAGDITLSYATGDVSGGANTWLGGFAGINVAGINQTFARGAVTGGDDSIIGGFVGVNFGIPGSFFLGQIKQAYGFGPTTSGADSLVASFSGVNFGSLEQVYGVGLVSGGTGSTTGGLAALSGGSFTLPDVAFIGGTPPTATGGGTATNSYWDRQTTGQTTSAGGTGMDTAQLASGTLPAGFDPSIWTHGSYPQLINLGRQNTQPGPAVLPPQSGGDQTNNQDQATDVRNSDAQSIVVNQLAGDLFLRILATVDPLIIPPPPPPPPPAPTGQTQGQQQQQQQTNPSQLPNGPIPGQIDAGPGRFFFVPPPGETHFVSNRVLVQVRPDITLAQLQLVASELGLTIVASQPIGLLGVTTYELQLPEGRTVADVVQAMVSRQIINGVQPIYNFYLTQEAPAAQQGPAPAGQETDLSGQSRREGDAAQYVLDKLHLQQVHQTIKGTNVKIAVIDSEIDAAHPDIKANIAARYDATGAEESPHPHGTGMAGAIVAHTRLMGIAPGAQIAAIHAFGSGVSPESTTINILKGLDWAINNGVRIINMSFAGPRDPSLERAIKAAHDKGIVLVAAAGNGGPRSAPLYPGADANVIAVTATDSDDRLFSGANRGRYIAIAAPGVEILAPAPGNTYQMTTGTSVATAHISGVVALLLERNPALKPDEVRRILQASAKRLGPNNEFGAGLVDPVKALELAAPRQASAAPPQR